MQATYKLHFQGQHRIPTKRDAKEDKGGGEGKQGGERESRDGRMYVNTARDGGKEPVAKDHIPNNKCA